MPRACAEATCFGFDNARDHAQQIAQRLKRPDLMPTADDAASVTGYLRLDIDMLRGVALEVPRPGLRQEACHA